MLCSSYSRSQQTMDLCGAVTTGVEGTRESAALSLCLRQRGRGGRDRETSADAERHQSRQLIKPAALGPEPGPATGSQRHSGRPLVGPFPRQVPHGFNGPWGGAHWPTPWPGQSEGHCVMTPDSPAQPSFEGMQMVFPGLPKAEMAVFGRCEAESKLPSGSGCGCPKGATDQQGSGPSDVFGTSQGGQEDRA